MKVFTKIKIAALFAVSIFIAVSCSTVTPVSTDGWRDQFEPDRSREQILSDFNLHRGKWWNYYSRACWLADGGFYNDAVLDLQKAIKVRSMDQRAARSYGMHFWEYFAHRELGVCYYNLGKFDEAVNELEASLQTVDSAKAKFYLNKSRLALLTQNGLDKNAPVIKVASYKDGDFVNSEDISLKGTINDDYFSNAVWVNNRKLFIELAEKDLDFDRKLKLEPGENTISIKAMDLVGNQTSRDLKLTLDMRSPVILLDDSPKRESIEQKTLVLKGSLVDDYGIEKFMVNGKEIAINIGKEIAFNETIDIALKSKITLEAVDVAGNKVFGEYSLKGKAAWLDIDGRIDPLKRLFSPVHDEHYAQLASTDNSLVASALNQPPAQSGNGQDLNPPKIDTDLKAVTVYDKHYVISGEAQDKTGIAKLFINDEEIKSNSAKHVFFNHILTLEEGDNNVTLTAEDVSGNKISLEPTTVKKETYEFLESDARYTVALMPFKRVGFSSATSDTVYPMLMQSFEKEPKRFNFVERDKEKLLELLNEQKISNSDLNSAESVVKIGKIRAAEGMFFGAIVEDDKSINVSLNLVDTETTKVLATADVYGENKGVDDMRWLLKGLALKMKQKFPMLQGSVVYVSKKGFFVDFGSDVGASLGMKFLLFREVDLGMMKIKEPLDAVAQIVQVDKQASMAKIIRGDDAVEKKDLVITK